MRRSLVNVLS